MNILLEINKVNCTLFVRDFFSLITSSQQMFKMFSIWTHTCSQSLSPLVDGRVNNVLLQTVRHQQGDASAHWCSKIYSCSS